MFGLTLLSPPYHRLKLPHQSSHHKNIIKTKTWKAIHANLFTDLIAEPMNFGGRRLIQHETEGPAILPHLASDLDRGKNS